MALSKLPVTTEVAPRFADISDLRFSPDGKQLAFVVSSRAQQSHIWVLDLRSTNVRQFTNSGKQDSSPRWSPDGTRLAFLSDKSGQDQIFVIPTDGGEALQLTSSSDSVSAFEWSPSGAEIAYLAPNGLASDTNDPRIADDPNRLDRLWTVDLRTGEQSQITTADWRIDQLLWLTDHQLVVIANPQPRLECRNFAIYTVNKATGEIEPLAQPNQPFATLSLTPKRNRIAFIATGNDGPVPHNMFVLDQHNQPVDLTKELDRRVNQIAWIDDDHALISCCNGFHNTLYTVNLKTSELAPIQSPLSIGDFDVRADNAIAFVGQDFTHLPELYIKLRSEDPIKVSTFNANWSEIALADAQIFSFQSFDGTSIESALMTPNKVASKVEELPLILYIHGGPDLNFTTCYLPWAQVLSAAGYQVLMVNPRGSSGYGEEFLKANRRDWGGGDFQDLMLAVDKVIDRGKTDPNRLGIAGWSYGGFMAEWAITQTKRFAAAVSGAGIFDLTAEFETEEDPAYDEWYFGTPWQFPERFTRDSPYQYIQDATTPTLILQGAKDKTDPQGQSTGLYRALKRYGIPCRLLIYPTQSHSGWDEQHYSDILKQILRWFDLYLRRESTADLPKDSSTPAQA